MKGGCNERRSLIQTRLPWSTQYMFIIQRQRKERGKEMREERVMRDWYHYTRHHVCLFLHHPSAHPPMSLCSPELGHNTSLFLYTCIDVKKVNNQRRGRYKEVILRRSGRERHTHHKWSLHPSPPPCRRSENEELRNAMNDSVNWTETQGTVVAAILGQNLA